MVVMAANIIVVAMNSNKQFYCSFFRFLALAAIERGGLLQVMVNNISSLPFNLRRVDYNCERWIGVLS